MNPAWRDVALEAQVLGQISLDAPWALVEAFSEIVRLSGSPEEARAAQMITDQLDAWGVAYELHHPTCLISLPGPATLRALGDDARTYTVKTPSFSPHTDGAEIEGELIYVPGNQAAGMNELFSEQRTATGADLRGKIVMTEGLGIAARGFDLAGSGAIAALFINPGERIHEGITTTAWGSPDLTSDNRVPPVPVLAINRSEGEDLIRRAQAGPVRVAFSNRTETGWRDIPVLVAEIPGNGETDEFVLFHGHLDSWHVGVGDNATGDATLLELARVFSANRAELRRSLRVAWWSGHSHGRYAGSTWYADAYAHDLLRNCVAHVNVDSPGCRWATVYEQVAWMVETERFAQAAIRDVTGLESTPEGHVLRAGDCSFNNLGVSTCFMLSSTMPQELLKQHNYHPVGGCGGNIAWHTEDDTMEIADRDNLLRDMRVYAAVLLRLLNAPVIPFDYRATIDEMAQAAQRYGAQGAHDLSRTLDALGALREVLDRFYAWSGDTGDAPAQVQAINAAQLELSRTLVSLNYSADGRFRQDPARAIPTLPAVACARDLADADDHRRQVLLHELRRAENAIVWELATVQTIVERTLQAAGSRAA